MTSVPGQTEKSISHRGRLMLGWRLRRRSVLARVQDRLHGFEIAGGYLYSRPFEFVLNGFNLEFTPTGVYLWLWRYPLFDRAGFVHLGFSERLPYPQGHLSYANRDVDGLVADILKTLTPHSEQARRLIDVRAFCELAVRKEALRNPPLARTVGLAYVLLDRGHDAARILREAAADLPDSEAIECREIATVAVEEAALAKKHVRAFVDEGIAKLGIELRAQHT